MATVNGVNYAKAADPSSDNVLAGGVYGGRVRVAIDKYTLASTVAGTVIRIASLPEGARILGVAIYNAALGSGVTVGVGYGTSGVELLAQTSAATAGKIESNLLGDYVVGTASGDGVIIVTTAGATGSGLITTHVYYTTD